MKKPLTIAEKQKRRQIVTTEYDGILPMTLVFYRIFVVSEATKTWTLLSQAKEIAENIRQEEENDQILSEALADTVQYGLQHAAALSRYLFPAFQRDHVQAALVQARGKKLREEFSVADSSPLSDRSLRNAFEHFDEYLDDFLLNDLAGVYVPSTKIGDHKQFGDDIYRVFKFIDISASVCILLGRRFDYGAIGEEAKRIASLGEG